MIIEQCRGCCTELFGVYHLYKFTIAGHHQEEPGSILLAPQLMNLIIKLLKFVCIDKIPFRPSLLGVEEPQPSLSSQQRCSSALATSVAFYCTLPNLFCAERFLSCIVFSFFSSHSRTAGFIHTQPCPQPGRGTKRFGSRRCHPGPPYPAQPRPCPANRGGTAVPRYPRALQAARAVPSRGHGAIAPRSVRAPELSTEPSARPRSGSSSARLLPPPRRLPRLLSG